MVSFELTDEQKSLRDAARTFARKEIVPKAAHFDQTMDYPWELVKKAHEQGLLNLSLPESLGGLGLGLFEQVLLYEELAYGCTGVMTAFAGNCISAMERRLCSRARWTMFRISSRKSSERRESGTLR